MNNYEVLDVIGEGTYGIVFKCRDKRTKRIVAVKQFKDFQTNAYIRVTMLRELRVEQLLKGEPNVTQLLETFKQKNRLFLVMEYIPRSLLDVLEEVEHGLSEEALKKLLYTILLGIRSCHRNGIIHRDVKPENILVRDDGTASLCDFGFCRPLPQQLQKQLPVTSEVSQCLGSSEQPPVARESSERNSLSTSEVLPRPCAGTSVPSPTPATLSDLVLADHQAIMTNYVATRWYRSPEMLLGMPSYTYAVDMWAVGAIMAEAIDGEPLLPGKTELEQLSLIQDRVGDFPPAYEAAVRKRNGGIVRLRSLNPLAAPAPQIPAQTAPNVVGEVSAQNAEVKSDVRISGYLTNRYGGRISKLGMNLLHLLLRIDAEERITVEGALQHPYFDSVVKHAGDSTLSFHPVESLRVEGDKVAKQTYTPPTEVPPATGAMVTTRTCSLHEILPSLTATPESDYVTPSFSLSCAAGDNAAFLVSPALPLVSTPASAAVKSGSTGCSGAESPLPRSYRGGRPPRPMTVEWERPALRPAAVQTSATANENSSNFDSSSLSLGTTSDASVAETTSEEVSIESRVCFPQLPGVLPPPNAPEGLKTLSDGEGAMESAREREEAKTVPPPHLTAWFGCGDSKEVAEGEVGRQRDTSGEGAKTSNRSEEPTASTEALNSVAAHHPKQRLVGPKGVQVSRRHPTHQGSAADAAISGVGNSCKKSVFRSPPKEEFDSNEATVSSRSSRRELVLLCEEALSKTARAPASRLCDDKSSSVFRTLSSPEHSPKHFSSPVARSLTHSATKLDSSNDALPPKRRAPGPRDVHQEGKLVSAPRKRMSRTRSFAAAITKGMRHRRASSEASGSKRSAPPESGSAIDQRYPSVPRDRGSGTFDSTFCVSASAHKNLHPNLSEAHTGTRSSVPVGQKPQSGHLSQRPPKPQQGTSVLAPGDAANRHACPTAAQQLSIIEAFSEKSAAQSTSEARTNAARETQNVRFASPKLPREVRPLPPRERVTLLKEIESLSFEVGTPRAVEELVPSNPIPPLGAAKRRDSGSGSGRRLRHSKGRSAFRAGKYKALSTETRAPPTEKSDKKTTTDVSSAAAPPLTEGQRPYSEAVRPNSWASTPPISSVSADKHQASTEVNNIGATTSGQCSTEVPRPQRLSSNVQSRVVSGGDNKSLTGAPGASDTTSAATGGTRAAPSLFFRSSRTTPSPLRLSFIHPTASTSHGDFAAPTMSSTVLREVSSSAASAAPGKSAPEKTPLDPERVSPALARPLRMGSDTLPSMPLSHSHSPDGVSSGGVCTLRTPAEAAVTAFCDSLRQDHFSGIPVPATVSGEVFSDSVAGTAWGGRFVPGKARTPSGAQLPTSSADLETVVLVATPPTPQLSSPTRSRQQKQKRIGAWSSTQGSVAEETRSHAEGSPGPSRHVSDSVNTATPRTTLTSLERTNQIHAGKVATLQQNSMAQTSAAATTRPLSGNENDAPSRSCHTAVPLSTLTSEQEARNAGPSISGADRASPLLVAPQSFSGGVEAHANWQLRLGGVRKKSRLVL